MNDEVVSRNVDSWVAEMDLPVRANLRPITAYSELSEEEEDELQARMEFIHWYMGSFHQILQLIPIDEYKKDFWQAEFDEDGDDISAFNTMDYQRNHAKSFNKYQWMKRKLCETVKHMAIDYSIFKDDLVKEKLRAKAFEFIRTNGAKHKETLFKVWLDYAYWK